MAQNLREWADATTAFGSETMNAAATNALMFAQATEALMSRLPIVTGKRPSPSVGRFIDRHTAPCESNLETFLGPRQRFFVRYKVFQANGFLRIDTACHLHKDIQEEPRAASVRLTAFQPQGEQGRQGTLKILRLHAAKTCCQTFLLPRRLGTPPATATSQNSSTKIVAPRPGDEAPCRAAA
jgi:hypothetical protein